MPDPSGFTPTVFLVLPHYGPVEMGAAMGFFCPTRQRDLRVFGPAFALNSLTPNCFNTLMVEVLNAYDQGLVTHVAMLHSDVCPRPGLPWLDMLWCEMRRCGLDLISNVIAVKEPEEFDDPPTSTAIGDPDDEWVVTKRLRVSDIRRTPGTFTAEDVCLPGEELLVNTGMWLADLRHQAWRDFPGFQIHTRLAKDHEGRRIAQCRPEDWEMSRWLGRRGVRIGATWAVEVKHMGPMGWSNRPRGERPLSRPSANPGRPASSPSSVNGCPTPMPTPSSPSRPLAAPAPIPT